jgi:hypothetical protein
VYTEKRILDLVRAHCHPPVTAVDVRVYLGRSTRGKAIEIVAIVVETQTEANSPVLVDRLVSDDADKLGSAVGWPTRHGADTSWAHGSRIQQLIGTGLRTPIAPSPSIPNDSRRERDLELVQAGDGWQDWAIVAIQMWPESETARVEDFYGSFRVAANGWRGIRDSGFGLALQWQPLEPSGDVLASRGSRTALIVNSDGLVTAAALGSPGFLGWAQHREETWSELKSVTLNPYPLVEFICEAIRFVYGSVVPKVVPTTWQIRVLGLHLQDRVPVAVRLQPGDSFFSTPVPATAPDVDVTLDGTGNWDNDAFSALEALLGRGFGVGRADIPFARDGTINPETFDK